MKQVMIADIDQENFSELVVFGSKRHPAVLVFWSDKNADSLQLIEAWETLAQQYAGQLIVGKLNVDRQSELAEKLGFKQLPLCKIVKEEAFVAEQEQWQSLQACEELLQQHLESDPSEEKRRQALDTAREGDYSQAESLLREAIEFNSDNSELHLDLLDVFLKQGKSEEAQTLFDQLPEAVQQSPRGKYLNGIFFFAEKANQGPGIGKVQEALSQNPNDPESLYALACILLLNGRSEHSLQALLKSLHHEQQNKTEKRAQEALIKAFNMLSGVQPELVNNYRRQMQSLLS